MNFMSRTGGAFLVNSALTTLDQVRMRLQGTASLATTQFTKFTKGSIIVDGSAADFSGLTDISGTDVTLTHGGTADLRNVASALGTSFSVSGGVVLSLQSLTSYSPATTSVNLQADGDGSVLDLSNVTTFAASNYVPANCSISLCLDTDRWGWNGNEKWIEIGKKTAVNGSDSYTFDTSGLAPGTYYVGGYLYNHTTHTPIYSHLSTPITIPAPTFTLMGPTSGSKAGVAPRTAQAAMRHSGIDLTMNVYTDPKLLDVAGAMDALPMLPLGDGKQTVANVLSATGTDDSIGFVACTSACTNYRQNDNIAVNCGQSKQQSRRT
jgi:hypothetical protein